MKYNTIAFSMLTVGLLSSTALHAGDIEQNLPATADAFTVDANGAELMRVNGDGNVGIGTITPPSKLTVVGLPDSSTVTGNKLGGRSIRITDNGSFYIPSVVAPAGYGVIYAGGKAWLDKNLGATTVATSWDDVTPSTLGDLYQWGRAADGHQLRTSVPTTLNVECSTVDTPLHAKFILSGKEPFDWRTQNANCTGDTRRTHFWTTPGASTTNGVCPTGWKVPSEQDFSNLDLESVEDAYTKIKLTLAGYHHLIFGTVNNVGTSGFYWTSSLAGSYSRSLGLSSGGAGYGSSYRAHGKSVRCLKNLD